MNHSDQLLFLGRCLSPDFVTDMQLTEEIQGKTIPWQQLLWLAGNHLVTPALIGSLRRKAVFGFLPEEAQNYLDTLQTLNRERNQIIYQELALVAQRLNQLGIEPLLLKGAIALLPDQYPGAEDRVIGDLDLMVPVDRVAEASAALQGSGYVQLSLERVLSRDRIRSHHVAPLLHSDLPVTVELHKRMLGNIKDDVRLAANLSAKTIVLPLSNARVRVPDLGTRLLHNFLHTQIQDKNHALLSLSHRQLLEFVLLRHWHGREWNWPELLSYLQPNRHQAFAVYLLAAERWYGQAMPSDLRIPPGSQFFFKLTERAQAEVCWQRPVAM